MKQSTVTAMALFIAIGHLSTTFSVTDEVIDDYEINEQLDFDIDSRKRTNTNETIDTKKRTAHPYDCTCSRSGFISSPKLEFKGEKRPWTLFVKIAARNDLHPFAKLNIRQMLEIGSNENVNIVVQLDEPGNKGTQRFFIEKNNALLVSQDVQKDSGDPKSLIDFCRWGVENYPADNYALFMWDHGTGGALDPHLSRSIDSLQAFNIDTDYNREQSQKPLNYPAITKNKSCIKGICFDDTYRTYINNFGLEQALGTIHREVLMGKKWSLIAFDACLMADLATAFITKDYAEIQVSSQNVEPGPGYRYNLVFSIFKDQIPSPATLALHIVDCYAATYAHLIGDYTHSAIDLSLTEKMENNINELSLLLSDCLKFQKEKSVQKQLQASCNSRACTHFDEPSYKDLGHLYQNLQKNIPLFQFHDEAQGNILQKELLKTIERGQELLQKLILKNCVGPNLSQASGISIYFPESRIHSSFAKTPFVLGKSNKKGSGWYAFLRHYLLS